MISKFFNVNLNDVYMIPTAERISEAYFNRLWRRLHCENFSLLLVFYGKHRVGKSLSAVSFCYILDETFEQRMEQRIVYNSKDLIQAFKMIREEKIKGGGIVIDEAGSGDLSNMRWYEEIAKTVSAELQAVGYLNPLICFVTQNFSFINSTARKLSQGVFEVERTNNLYSTIRPYWIETNPWISGFYRRYPIFCENRNNVASNVYKVSRIKMGLPPLEIRKRYEAHSQAYKDKLLDESENQVDMMNLKKVRENAMVAGIEKVVEDVTANYQEYLSISKKRGIANYLNENLIRHRHHLNLQDSKLVKALVEKKINEGIKASTTE